MYLLKRLIKNEYVFAVVTKIYGIVISMLRSALVARFLGASLKGTSAYIQSIVSIGYIIVMFGMHQAYPYLRRKYGKDSIYNEYFTFIFTLYFVLSTISIVFSLVWKDTIVISSAFLIVITGYSNIVGYVSIIENPNKKNTISAIIDLADIFVIVILFIFFDANSFWMMFLLFLEPTLVAIIFSFTLNVKITFGHMTKVIALELLKFGFFPMLALLMTILNYRIDVLMLKSYRYITNAQMGIYSIGITLADKIVLLPDTLKGIMVSKLAKGANEHEVARVCRICFISSCIFCVIIILLGQWGINILYGEEYRGAYNVVLITAIGTVFVGYFKLIAQYNIINKKQILNVFMLGGSIIINVIGNSLLVPRFGINGAAISTSVAQFVCGFVFLFYFLKTASIRIKEMIVLQKEDYSLMKNLFTKK